MRHLLSQLEIDNKTAPEFDGGMKKIMILSLSFVLLAAVHPSRPIHKTGETLYRYTITAPATMNPLQLMSWLTQEGFDIAGVRSSQRQVEVITDERGLNRLHQQKIQGQIRAQKIRGEKVFTPDSRYLNPQKLEARLKELNQKFPNITRLEKIGTSTRGQPIYALLISSTPDLKNPALMSKPSFLVDGLHHAREVMTSEVVLGLAEMHLAALARREVHAVRMNQGWNLWFVPMLNVDGNGIVWNEDSWWRKNARAEGASTYGVDLNRNYGYRWGQCNGSSGAYESQTYRGPSAASEPEVQALNNLAQFVRPTGYLSFHSYGELILFPYGCRGEVTGENALISKVAQEMSALLPTDDNRSRYRPGTPWQTLYPVDGDSMSYMYSEFGSLALTYEINEEFQPDFELKTNTVAKHRKAWTSLLERMNANLLTLRVVDGKTGKPAIALLGISTIAKKSGEKPFRTNAGGFYFKTLDPGAYQIQLQLPDGRTQQLNVKMTGQPQTLDVVL